MTIELVARESILRRTSYSINLKQRLSIDTVVFSADKIEYSYGELLRFAEIIRNEQKSSTISQKLPLFMHSWSIIENLHICRKMLPKIFDKAPNEILEFCEKSELANTLRNKISHISENLNNFSKIKGSRSAFLGTLSYVYADNDAYEECEMIILSAVTMHPGQNGPVSDPFKRKMINKYDLFQIEAFNIKYEFISTIIELKDTINSVEKYVTNAINRITKDTSVELKYLSDELYNYPAMFFNLKRNDQ